MTLLQRYMSGYRTLSCGIPLLLFALLFQLVAFPLTGHADDAVEIRDVRHWENRDFIRFVFDLSLPVEFTSGRIANPERLFFDLKNTKLAKGLRKSFDIRHEFVKALRLGQYSSDVARIVFDLQTQSYNFKVMNLEDPARLVIDIYTVGGKGNEKGDLRAETEIDALRPDEKDLATDRPEDSYAPDINVPVSNPRNRFIKRTVVVDAGHGGHDPGAVGPSGLYEKNVVLDIAIRVRAIMKKDYPSCDVVLTRETDVFIPLPDRAKIANDHKADLFVSIHANASPNRKARGIETYLLNWTSVLLLSDSAGRTASGDQPQRTRDYLTRRPSNKPLLKEAKRPSTMACLASPTSRVRNVRLCSVSRMIPRISFCMTKWRMAPCENLVQAGQGQSGSSG